MYNNDIEISGVTPKNRLPRCDRFTVCKEIVETDKCCIPCQKPDMYEICHVFVNVEIIEKKVICTSMGYKIILTGCKHIKVMYSSDDCHSRVHSAHFDIPFTEFVLLGKGHKEVRDIESAIEYISVCQSSKRCFYISTLILLCARIKERCDFNYENNKCKKYFNECENYCDCEEYCEEENYCDCEDYCEKDECFHDFGCHKDNYCYDDNLVKKDCYEEEDCCNKKINSYNYFHCCNEDEF